MESYRRLRGAGSHSSKGRLLMRDGIFLLNRRGLRHGKFWPMRRQIRIRYWWKGFMAQKEAPAYISWQSDPLRTVTDDRVHRESTPRVHRHSGRENRQESAVHIEWDTESLRIGW